MARIFIVEDNKDHLISLETKVEFLGHEVVGTSIRAIDALAGIKNTNPQILLLDINLNGDNDGIVLANQIKEFSSTSIIYVTALTSSQVITDAVATNPSGYLIKPVSLDELEVNIKLALQKIDIATVYH